MAAIKTIAGGLAQLPDLGIYEWSETAGEPFPKIEPKEMVELKHNGNELIKSGLYQYLPFLSVYVSNRSNCNIQVQIGYIQTSAYTVEAKRGRPLDFIPFKTLYVKNLSDTETIKEGDIIITAVNDMDGIRKYADCVTSGLIAPLNIPLPQTLKIKSGRF